MTDNQLSVSSNIALSSDYYINKNISEIVMSYVNKMNNNASKTIGSVIIGVGLIIVADVVKFVVLDFLKEQKKQINEGLTSAIKEVKIFPVLVWIVKLPYSMLNFTYNLAFEKFQNIFWVKDNNGDNHEHLVVNDDENQSTYFEIETSQMFISNLIEFIETNKDTCKYNKVYDKNIKMDKSNIVNDVKYSDIDIKFDNINVKIFDDVIKSRDKCNISKINFGDILFTIMEEYLSLNITKSYYNLQNLPNFQNYLCHFDGSALMFYNDIAENGVYWSTSYIFTMCLKNYKHVIDMEKIATYCTCNVQQSNILFISAFIAVELCEKYSNIIDVIQKMNNHENIKITPRSIKFNYYYYRCGNNMEILRGVPKPGFNFNFISESKFKKLFNELQSKNSLCDNTPNTSKISNAQNTTNSAIKFYVSSLENKKNDNNFLNKKVKELLLQINNLSLHSLDKNKIKIYTLKIENKILTKSIQNPQYGKYLSDKKQLLDEDANIKTDRIISLLGSEPEKELLENYVNKEVKMDLINERYTSFDNLYLSKQQDVELCYLYNSFINDKEENEDLGISNKLCILLHGEPGTGKTTTIITTASYFRRDIFYISLKNISNDDLKMMFDFISVKHTNQGIIIFEDFDAMTGVVAKRQTETNYSLIDVIDDIDKNLTLDYFLNLLDGTLTRDGSIIIMTTNHIEKIDPAIYRPGRVDKIIEMKKCDHYQISKIFKRFIKRDISDEILVRIKEYTFTPAEIISEIKKFIKMRNEADCIILKNFIE